MSSNLGIDILLDQDGDLQATQTGDLAVTPTGRVCLLQDISHLLDTLPGDLFGHPEFGAGVTRLAGEEDRPDFSDLVMRAITDALMYDESVAPRIEADSVVVTVVNKTSNSIEFNVAFQPLDEEYTTMDNLVWRFS